MGIVNKTRVTIYLNKNLCAQLDVKHKATGISRSKLIEMAVEQMYGKELQAEKPDK